MNIKINMEDFEWQDEDVQQKYRMFVRILNKTMSEKLDIIKKVDVNPVSFQTNYLSMGYYKTYKVKIYIDSSVKHIFTEEMLDNIESRFTELFDTLIKTVAEPRNKKNFVVMVDAEPELI